MTDSALSRRSRAVQALGLVDPGTGAIVPPIHLSTTFERDADGTYPRGHLYSRPDNPNLRAPEGVIAMLEGAAAALVFGSGQAAITACFLTLKPGDHVIAPRIVYTGTRHWLAGEGRAWGLSVDFVDAGSLDAIRAAVRPGATKLIHIETPANPLWTVSDIAGVAAIAREAGARLVVDSTVATPVLTRPLEWGADAVVHSATKYLNGHSDVLAGAVAVAREDEFLEGLRRARAMYGAVLSGLDCHLLVRGMRTLHLRVREQSRSAMALAERLSNHGQVEAVLYPGLAHHPNHAVAARQMKGGFGGMLSIAVRGGEAAAVGAAAGVRLWKRATSLGGVESLIEHRASIEGEGTPCPANVLRLSVGLEDVEDLGADLDQALRAAA